MFLHKHGRFYWCFLYNTGIDYFDLDMLSPFSCPTLEGSAGPVTLTDPIFISDLHLSHAEPDTLHAFLRFLKSDADQHRELLILGDFFDYWIGDDASFTMQVVVDALRQYAKTHALYIMHGNRDFMMGERFAKEIGATLLKDPTIAKVGQQTLLLSHGDAWCTRDHDYQAVRRRVRSIWWQWLVMRLPLKKRLSIAENARAKSLSRKSTKAAYLTDVTPEVVLDAATQAQAKLIIHGHTHRPTIEAMTDTVTRIVLPDWHFVGDKPQRGGYVCFDGATPKLVTFTERHD